MYPPKLHTEKNPQKLHAVIEAFPLATVISTAKDQIHTTPLPLILDPDLGDKGVLVGHLDRSNPQAELLDDGPVKVIFHGPNSYISPHVYTSSQLPTWNYIQVHVNGHSRLLQDHHKLYDSLVTMTEKMEKDNSSEVLKPHEDRIHHLLDYLTGFTITIEQMIGRFKLSQNRDAEDTIRAKQQLIEQSSISHAELIDFLLE